MQKNTYTWRSHPVSAVKKPTASIPAACARRNFAQDWPARRGAGPTPAARRILHTAAAGTRYPVPQARLLTLDPAVAPCRVLPGQPQDQPRTSARVGGRPGRRRGYVHFLATSSRCQRTTVAGVTKNGVLPAQDRDLVAYN